MDYTKELAKAIKESRSYLDAGDMEKYEGMKDTIADLRAKAEAQKEQRQLEEEYNRPAEERQVVYEETPPPKEEEKRFGSLGEQLVAVKRHQDGHTDQRLLRASGLNETVGSEGGFLVQTDYSNELMKRVYETGALASRTRKVTVKGDGLIIPTIDETSRANGSRWGGVQSYWASEAGTVTSSKPKFGQLDLRLKKLMALSYATDELLQDSNALESIISDAFNEEIGFKVDDAIMNGTGAGQPLGILNSDALVTVAKESGQDGGTLVTENIVKMWSRLYGKSRANAVWFINQDIEPELFTMSLAVGTGGVPVYMPANGLAGSPYGTLMGRPVIPIEHCSTLGTVGDIVLADMSQYMLIDKGGVKSDASMHVRFLYDEMAYRFITRLDGQPLWKKALTPFKGSNTQSPFVALATRA